MGPEPLGLPNDRSGIRPNVRSVLEGLDRKRCLTFGRIAHPSFGTPNDGRDSAPSFGAPNVWRIGATIVWPSYRLDQWRTRVR